jgi:hypothetical protein
VGFSPSGDPLGALLVFSPDGSLAAAYGDTYSLADGPLVVDIGPTSAFTTSCTERAWTAAAKESGAPSATGYLSQMCPGVAQIVVNHGCYAFNGFVSNNAFVCFDGADYDKLSFMRDDGHARITADTQLTPTTNLQINGGLVDPSGMNLWFADQNGDVYVVPTSTPTSEPTASGVAIGQNSAGGTGQFATDGLVIGWRWLGHMVPAANDNSLGGTSE